MLLAVERLFPPVIQIPISHSNLYRFSAEGNYRNTRKNTNKSNFVSETCISLCIVPWNTAWYVPFSLKCEFTISLTIIILLYRKCMINVILTRSESRGDFNIANFITMNNRKIWNFQKFKCTITNNIYYWYTYMYIL